MEDLALQVFSSEVRLQAGWGIAAADSLAATVAVGIGEGTSDPFLWLAVLTGCAANVSKLLWGGKTTEAERQPLRAHFQVADNSPLRDRTLRDELEHFDQRIGDWAKPRPDGAHRFFADRLLGGPAGPRTIAPMMFLGGASPKDAFRYYDRGGFVIFRGVRFQLTPIVTELRRLLTFPEYRPQMPPRPSQRKPPAR
jgi:hypothetical protein